MGSLEHHLNSLVNLITTEKRIESAFEKDFMIIRQYLFEILLKDKIMQVILKTKPKELSKVTFPTALVLDLSAFLTLDVKFHKQHTPFLDVRRIRDIKPTNKLYLPPLPFIKYTNEIDAEAVIVFIRKLITKGLEHSGCFVRGHQNEVYELELCENKERLTINAISDCATLSIDFRVLVGFSLYSARPMSFPHNVRKQNWLVAVNRCRESHEDFTVCVPELETELAKRFKFCTSYRLLCHLLAKQDCNMPDAFLSSLFYELILKKTVSMGNEKLNTFVEIITYILMSLMRYLKKNEFPFYWSTKVNLMKYFKNRNSAKSSLCRNINYLQKRIFGMQKNSNLSFDEVVEFFGIQVNSEVIKVDTFGIFRSF